MVVGVDDHDDDVGLRSGATWIVRKRMALEEQFSDVLITSVRVIIFQKWLPADMPRTMYL